MRTNNLIRITIVILAFVLTLAITINADSLHAFITTQEISTAVFLKQNECQEITSSKISTKSLPNDKNIIYQWEYNGSSWEWKLELPGDLYDYSDKKRFYKNSLTSVKHDFLKYITDDCDDNFVTSLADSFLVAADENGMTEIEKINLIIAFVQAIPYKEDIVTRGIAEYPRFPIQTLWDGHGDCEDTAILLCSLLNAVGYSDNILISSSNHMAVGIVGDFEGEYYIYNGKKYYYIETTVTGWKIGQKPSSFIDVPLYVVE